MLQLQNPCKKASLKSYRETCTSYYGCPQGASGRPLGTAIQGIVIHYLGMTQDEYVSSLETSLIPPAQGVHHSVHYTINPNGIVLNHVHPDDLAWAHRTCASNFPEPLDPVYDYPGWPVLSAANSTVPLDYYTIHIGITQEGTRSAGGRCDNNNCDGWHFGLLDSGYTALLQLLAGLSNQYGIPTSSEYIQFHEYIEPVDTSENIPCFDGCLVCDVASHCEECENYRDNSYSNEYDISNMAALYGETIEGCKGRICISDVMSSGGDGVARVADTYPGMAAGCNGIVETPSGLAVMPAKMHVLDGTSYTERTTQITAFSEDDSNTDLIEETFLLVENPSPCYEMRVKVDLFTMMRLTITENDLGTQFAASGGSEWTSDGGANWAQVQRMETQVSVDATSTTGVIEQLANEVSNQQSFFVTIPPMSSSLFGFRSGYVVLRGSTSASVTMAAQLSVTGSHI